MPSVPLLVTLSLLADAAALSVLHSAFTNGRDGRLLPACLQVGTLALYLLGCAVAANEPRRFARRFASKVRNAEVMGVSPTEIERLLQGPARPLSIGSLFFASAGALRPCSSARGGSMRCAASGPLRSVPIVRPLASHVDTWCNAARHRPAPDALVLYTCTVGVPSLGIVAVFEEQAALNVLVLNTLCAALALLINPL